MSNVWHPRLSAPSNTDPNFINRNYGGYNGCIPIQGNGCVMPNCTGYAWGRWLETAGSCNLSTSNAANWFGNTGDGYARGSVPALGACICFSTAGGQPGHVAIVEEIIDNDTIVTSDSNYGAEYFVTRTRRRAWGWNWWSGGNLYFQGFIYNPAGWSVVNSTSEFSWTTMELPSESVIATWDSIPVRIWSFSLTLFPTFISSQTPILVDFWSLASPSLSITLPEVPLAAKATDETARSRTMEALIFPEKDILPHLQDVNLIQIYLNNVLLRTIIVSLV